MVMLETDWMIAADWMIVACETVRWCEPGLHSVQCHSNTWPAAISEARGVCQHLAEPSAHVSFDYCFNQPTRVIMMPGIAFGLQDIAIGYLGVCIVMPSQYSFSQPASVPAHRLAILDPLRVTYLLDYRGCVTIISQHKPAIGNPLLSGWCF